MVTEAIEDAVAVRLRADVPVGVVLSSGLDSSAVSTLAAQRQGRGVKAFTFGHPRDRRSEARLVQRLADALGVDTRFTDPETRGIIEAFFDTLEAQGAPFTSGSVVGQYCVYREAHAAGVKVLLGGQGGDEAFMGYRKFYLFWLEHLVAKRRYAEALACAGGLVRMALAEVPRASSYWAASVRYRRRGWSGGVLALPPCDPLPLRPVAASPLRLRQMEDVTRWSLPTLLRYEDRNSMANSVESRLPFMDHRVVELGLALPESMKVRHGYGKWIVREAMRGRVPERIRAARWKRGFDVGQERWIRRGLGRAIRGAILARRRAAAEWLAPGVRVEEAFSDRALIRRGGGFAEATTLIWLGGLQRDTGSPERRGPHAEVSA
jgi:asparagine synthase (glutamine-hydrolysing)